MLEKTERPGALAAAANQDGSRPEPELDTPLGAMAGPGTMSSGTGTLDSLARSLGMSETRAFQSGIRGLEQSPSGATFKRVVTVVLRYCYGGAPMWVAQRTVIEQLAKALRR